MSDKPSDYDKSFKAARLGHNDSGPIARTHPSKVTYMAHGKGYVMCRHRSGTPFVITESLWRSFPLFDRT